MTKKITNGCKRWKKAQHLVEFEPTTSFSSSMNSAAVLQPLSLTNLVFNWLSEQLYNTGFLHSLRITPLSTLRWKSHLKNFGRSEIRTRGLWVWSAKAVICAVRSLLTFEGPHLSHFSFSVKMLLMWALFFVCKNLVMLDRANNVFST